ncbi:MAG: PilZ domain-containing protein [Terriglobia bacterium]
MDERRNARRFLMNLPVEIQEGLQSEEAFATETRDVSSRGLYFVLDRNIESGSPIEFVLTLPKELTLAGDVRIYCAGRVVRVEKPETPGAVGVAAVIDRYEFLRPN